MKIQYVDKSFRGDTLAIIRTANRLIQAFKEDGVKEVTLRQLYYAFISAEEENQFPDSWIDEAWNRKNGLDPNTKNTLKNYKRLAGILVEARLAGLVDWDVITDRTRNLSGWRSQTSPGAAVRMAAITYRRDPWENQTNRVEVWGEKETLSGIMSDALYSLHVPFMACRGNMSLSEIHEAGQRLKKYAESGLRPIVIYVGDHDPSGLDMSRDILDRLSLFMGRLSVWLTVDRIALNYDQVLRNKLPPNPAKKTDSRFAKYAAQYGDESWELDALRPSVLKGMIRGAVEKYMDREAFEASRRQEATERALLTKAGDEWTDVARFLGEVEVEVEEDVDWEDEEESLDEGDGDDSEDWNDDEEG